MPRFHNVLAAVDFSVTSDDALAAAVELCNANRARLHLLHVVPSVQVPYAAESIVFDVGEFLSQSVEAARQQLDTLAAAHPVTTGPPEITVVSGPPAREIVRYAREEAIDLIVLGAHGHGFLDRLLVGSVAERGVRHAPCAVLLIPRMAERQPSVELQAAAATV